MESSSFALGSLLIVAVLALLVPLIVSSIKFIRVPIVVGEVLIGVVVGKSGFNIIQDSQWLQFLQFFGLSYLMFVSGLELDFKSLRPSTPGKHKGIRSYLTDAPAFATITCAITFGLSFLLSSWLHQHQFIRSPLLVALIITTTSLTVVVPVLKEYELLHNSFGQLLMAAAMFADFVTMLLISVAAAMFQGGMSPKLLLVFVLIFILLLLYRLFRWFGKYKAFNNLAHGTAQIGIRASMALMIIFMVLSETLGVQVILGTFLAGILVGLVNEQGRTDVFNKLDAIGFGFLIPIFFVMVGVQFDFRSLLTDPKALLLLPILLVATYVFKALPLLILKFRYPWRDTLAGAALLTTQMSVTIAAAAVGVKIGAISPSVNTAIILVAMISAVVSPVAFGKILPAKLQAKDKKVLIIGNLPGTQLLVDLLKERNHMFQWVSEKEDWILQKSTANWNDIRAVVAYTNDDNLNVEIAQEAVLQGTEAVICFIRDLALFQEHNQDSAFITVNPQLASVTLIDQIVNYPISTQLLKVPGSMQIQEVVFTSRELHGTRLQSITFPGNVLVMSIYRDGAQIVPHGQTDLRIGDTVVVVGDKEDIAEFRRMARA